MKDISHGSAWSYFKHKCRCDACTEANRQKVLQRKSGVRVVRESTYGQPSILDSNGMQRRAAAKAEMRRLIDTRAAAIYAIPGVLQ